FLLSLAVLALSGGADMVSVVVRQTLVQLDTPDAMRGRVGAVNSMFIGASNQLGEFESGATAALMGPVGSVVVGGLATARALAVSLGLDFRRIQFTADLMPSDIVGGPVYNPKDGTFALRLGPVFANVVLADEINRANPRAQSALLECMEEGQLTLDGQTV